MFCEKIISAYRRKNLSQQHVIDTFNSITDKYVWLTSTYNEETKSIYGKKLIAATSSLNILFQELVRKFLTHLTRKYLVATIL